MPVLQLRIQTRSDRTDRVIGTISAFDGVDRIVEHPVVGPAGKTLIAADVSVVAVDELVTALRSSGVSRSDFVITRADVVYPSATRGGGEEAGDVPWLEVLSEARESARPVARYLVLMAVAGVIAALGVLTANPILTIGAMAVSPDLLPICALCVAIVGRRVRLAGLSATTLVVGMVLSGLIGTLLTTILIALGIVPADLNIHSGGLRTLPTLDYSTLIVAVAAGIAAMLAFETRSSQTVGVAISVTTIPASAFFGVALGLGDMTDATSALLVLATNIVVIAITGSLTLALQVALGRRHHGSRRPIVAG